MWLGESMRKRHPNPRRLKIHRHDTLEEVARLFGVSDGSAAGIRYELFVKTDSRLVVVTEGKVKQ